VKLLFIFLFVPFFTVAQHQERTVLLYNTLLGGLTGGIGATINKSQGKTGSRPLQKGFGKAVLEEPLITQVKKHFISFINIKI